jgi:hypothetical protein
MAMAPQLAMLAAAALIAAPLVAQAQLQGPVTYRCTAKDGKKYRSDTVPPQCLGQPIELLNAQGFVVKRIDPAGDERERAAKEVDAVKKRELEAANKDIDRRNRALLATYTSEKDIESARARALADNQKAVSTVEQKIAEIKQKRARYEKELALYQEKKDKGSPPPVLKENISNADMDLQVQEDLLAQKRKEAEAINAKYDDDKKRFHELMRRK